MTEQVRRGRRPGTPDTRAEILAAARESFAAAGFAGTTIRGVAAAAGVDAALVHHYFGSKESLFLTALEVPVDPRVELTPVLERGVDEAGAGIVRTMLRVWDDEDRRLPLLAFVRRMLEPGGGRLLSEGFLPVLVEPVAVALGVADVDRRMPLVASQLFGVIMLRYVVPAEPLASMPAEEVVASVAPTIQRYLTGDLPKQG